VKNRADKALQEYTYIKKEIRQFYLPRIHEQ